MIHISNIQNQNLGCSDVADEVWAIVRSGKRVPFWMQHIPELSPSWELFKQYLTWRDCGHWNKETFEQKYVPRFLSEFKDGGEQVLNTLVELKRLDDAGKHVYLVCFCQDESLCHRSIVAGILQGLGFNVDAPDYSRYYQMLQQGTGHQSPTHNFD